MTIKDQYTTFTAEMTVMSPMFIGSGEELNKTMYHYKEAVNEVQVADMKKLRQHLAEYNLFDEYSEYLLSPNGPVDLYSWLKSRGPVNDIWKYTVHSRVPLKNITRAKNSKYNNSQVEKPKVRLHNIKTFIKNANGNPYIPGSSLKGVIRTALLYQYIFEHKKDFANEWDEISNLYKYKDIIDKLKQLTKKINDGEFATITTINDDGKEVKFPKFQAIRILDSDEFNSSKLFIGKRMDLSITKNYIKDNSTMPIVAEMLKPGTKIKFEIIIDKKLDKEGYFTKERIEDALNLFAKEQNEQYQEFKNKNISNLCMPNDIRPDMKMPPNICLGGLAGFWSKTVIHAFAPTRQSAVDLIRKILPKLPKGKNKFSAERDKRVAPQVMKLIKDNDKCIPIGWARLELVEKEIKE